MLLVIVIAFIMIDDKSPEELPPETEIAAEPQLGNLQGNIANGGTAVMSGNAVYLADPLQDNRLIRVSPGKVEGTPVGDLKGSYLNVAGDTLYYVDGNTSYLMKAKLDGTGAEALLEKPISRLKLADGYLYYLDTESDNTLCRLSPDGEEAPLLLSDARIMQYAFFGGKIFYHDLNRNGDSYYMDMDGGNVQEIRIRLGQTIFAQGNTLYYSDEERNGAISYIAIDGEGMHGPYALDTGVVLNAVADKGFLYYVQAKNGLLCRRSLTDAEAAEEVLTESPVYGLQIAGNYIYYNSVEGEGALGCISMSAAAVK